MGKRCLVEKFPWLSEYLSEVELIDSRVHAESAIHTLIEVMHHDGSSTMFLRDTIFNDKIIVMSKLRYDEWMREREVKTRDSLIQKYPCLNNYFR